jgi:hypothetical protein
MSRRLELHDILVRLLGSGNVYFQPPSTVKMHYPCIVYRRSQLVLRRANDALYRYTQVYTVTVIDPDPDSDVPIRVSNLPLCRFDRHYTADNLNHDVYSVYY